LLRHTSHLRTTALAVLAAVLCVLVAIGVAAAAPGKAHPRCTYGVSSIGPVIVKDGKVVGGDTTPHTEACLR
jgi:hypothetical protein